MSGAISQLTRGRGRVKIGLVSRGWPLVWVWGLGILESQLTALGLHLLCTSSFKVTHGHLRPHPLLPQLQVLWRFKGADPGPRDPCVQVSTRPVKGLGYESRATPAHIAWGLGGAVYGHKNMCSPACTLHMCFSLATAFEQLFEFLFLSSSLCGLPSAAPWFPCLWLCHLSVALSPVLWLCRGGINSWQNLVTACMSCNQRKGDKSLAQLGWKLPQAPREPTPQEVGVLAGISKVRYQAHGCFEGPCDKHLATQLPVADSKVFGCSGQVLDQQACWTCMCTASGGGP